jgi:hypothetical protein
VRAGGLLLRRLAAFVAMWALALNVVLAAYAPCDRIARDAFGEPVCSQHQDGAAQPSDPAKDDSHCCDLCGVVPLATAAAAYVPDAPVKLIWTRVEPVALERPLPAPSRHRLAPPRGPPLA